MTPIKCSEGQVQSSFPWLLAPALIAWAVLFGLVAARQPASTGAYVFFSLAFLVVVLRAVFAWRSAFFFFCGTFMFLGFWLKHAVHLLDGSPWLEPIGGFDESMQAWDSVLTVAAVAAVGAAAAHWTVDRLVRIEWPTGNAPARVPGWFLRVRPLAWSLAVIAVVAFLVANETLGLIRLGRTPGVTMPWPWHGLIAWLTNIGLPMVLATLAYWDFESSRRWKLAASVVVTGALLIAASTMSRGLFAFHTAPHLAALYRLRRYRENASMTAIILALAAYVVLLVGSVTASNVLRYFVADPLPVTREELDANKRIKRPPLTPQTVFEQALVHGRIILVERWTGLEGVMAVQGYEGRGAALLARGLAHRRTLDRADLYTAEISRSGFTDRDTLYYQYATLPGPAAFFWYSGSLVVVFTGMFLLVAVGLLAEVAVARSTGNPLLCAVTGLYLALVVMQFGTAPIQTATALVPSILLIAAIAFIQRRS